MSDTLPLSPNSPSSFTNPFFHPFKQLMESSSPRSSQIITQPTIQQLQNKEKTPTGNIQDGGKLTLERSMSSDRSDFNSSIDSKTDLLDDNFDSNSQNDAPPITLLSPTHAANVPITKPKPSGKNYLGRCQSFGNFEILLCTTHSPFYFSSSYFNI
jgi:hypothetical protein